MHFHLLSNLRITIHLHGGDATASAVETEGDPRASRESPPAEPRSRRPPAREGAESGGGTTLVRLATDMIEGLLRAAQQEPDGASQGSGGSDGSGGEDTIHVRMSVFQSMTGDADASASAGNPPRTGLTAEELDRATTLFVLTPDGGAACSICQGGGVGGEIWRDVRACGHTFHARCLDPWLSRNYSCPDCRSDLRTAAA